MKRTDKIVVGDDFVKHPNPLNNGTYMNIDVINDIILSYTDDNGKIDNVQKLLNYLEGLKS